MEQESGAVAQLCLPLADTQAAPTSSEAHRRHRRPGRPKDYDLRCAHCGVRVRVPTWFQDSDMILHYCGVSCREAWARTEESFAVRLDIDNSRRRRGANWQIQAREARYRDECRCQECGVTEEELGQRLHVHHRIPYRRFHSNVEANKLEHLVSVCPTCHGRLEAQLRRELPLFAGQE